MVPSGVDTDLRLTQSGDHSRNGCIRPAAEPVSSGYRLRVLRGIRHLLARWRRVGEIAIEETFPQCRSSGELRISQAVVRDEEADVVVEHQMHVAMHPLRVTAVSDDAMAVARLLIEAVRHAIHRRHQPEGA